MQIYLIRLKDHPTVYVGKQNPTYAIRGDSDDRPLQLDAHWYVPRQKAKLFSRRTAIKQFVNRYNKGDTFSKFEVEIDGKRVKVMSLDDFLVSDFP